jgi:hypothetical protein
LFIFLDSCILNSFHRITDSDYTFGMFVTFCLLCICLVFGI